MPHYFHFVIHYYPDIYNSVLSELSCSIVKKRIASQTVGHDDPVGKNYLKCSCIRAQFWQVKVLLYVLSENLAAAVEIKHFAIFYGCARKVYNLLQVCRGTRLFMLPRDLAA